VNFIACSGARIGVFTDLNVSWGFVENLSLLQADKHNAVTAVINNFVFILFLLSIQI
jgi:hypothetical protein